MLIFYELFFEKKHEIFFEIFSKISEIGLRSRFLLHLWATFFKKRKNFRKRRLRRHFRKIYAQKVIRPTPSPQKLKRPTPPSLEKNGRRKRGRNPLSVTPNTFLLIFGLGQGDTCHGAISPQNGSKLPLAVLIKSFSQININNRV